MPANHPFYSVVVPCYRCAGTITLTVESVLGQSFDDFEIILVNDGSPDNTLEVLHQLEKRDARIKVFSQDNGGVSSARNLGIREARGEVIAFLDSDDVWVPKKLARHFDLFNERGDVSVSYAQIRFLTPEGAPTAVTSNRPVDGLDVTILLAENVACTTSNLLARREVFERVGHFDESLDFDEDKEWLFRAFISGETMRGIDEVLTGYRTSPGGLASDPAQMEEEWLRYVEIVRERAPDAVAKAFPAAKAIFLRNLARRCLRLGMKGRTAIRYFIRAVRSSPRAIRTEPRRWIMTGAASLAVAILPSRFGTKLMRRLDLAPSRLPERSAA